MMQYPLTPFVACSVRIFGCPPARGVTKPTGRSVMLETEDDG